jgi:hypothetical protein
MNRFVLILLSLISVAVPIFALGQNNTVAANKSNSPDVSTSKIDNRSLEATFQWIQQQVEKHSGSSYEVSYPEKGYSWHHTNAYGNLQLNQCVMMIDQTYQNNSRPQRGFQYSVPLWDLASASYDVDGGNQQFKYKPGVAALYLRTRTKSMHWKRPKAFVATDLVELEFGTASTANQAIVDSVGRAFMHMQALCAAQAPKSAPANEPAAAQPK